ncbi:FG-GAP repeat domain-containing protein [Cyclobacterium marinum]|uniref:FG-GAP repeat-containing protein n=1 Tax=Cyclobacterium marinum (strain ATCC 25205 / DSM 745 / LMG 13164 / NCIMB 1802) TaxID=880070 RepID=G0IYS6_CYCMS|nr:VCBS repeat-containing protein [Cyclobacterium marinum]AEL27259.1 FG-GAP repeat-containing protein [Cyclobacterium marinum DSM 745]
MSQLIQAFKFSLVVALFSGINSAFPQSSSPVTFKKHVLSTQFLAEGAAIGDVNQDGLMDVMAGAYWFEAPKWKPHELEEPKVFEYDKGYSNAFISHGMDVNMDGWVDFVRIGFPGEAVHWFENPKNQSGLWKIHIICPSLGNESAGFYDVDKDGRKDLVGSIPETGEMVWYRAPSTPNNLTWDKFTISKKNSPGTARYSHGLGMGDIDQDGNKDLIITEGWWKSPDDPTEELWEFQPATLGEPAAQLYAHDINGDHKPEILSSAAHQLGIWWHEQDQTGAWKTHLIDKSFSQTHALELVDINKDGHLDLVTGKRYYAHMGKDPGGNNPPVLAWFEFKPSKQDKWLKHIIDTDSGVGVQVTVADFFGHGLMDIIVANKKGVFVFEQVPE